MALQVIEKERSIFKCRSCLSCKYDRDDVCNFQTLVRDSNHPPQVAVVEGGKGLCMKEEKIKKLDPLVHLKVYFILKYNI